MAYNSKFGVFTLMCLTVGSAGIASSPVNGAHFDQKDKQVLQLAASQQGASNSDQAYFVRFKRQPVATYKGELNQLPKPERNEATGRLLPKGDAASAYARFLVSEQNAFLSKAEQMLQRGIQVRHRYQYTLNAVSVVLTAEEAARLATDPAVEAIEPVMVYEQHTDLGPNLIEADQIWSGAANNGTGSKGEGVVIGIIDSGINSDHPSFADSVSAADGGDGYDHTNPLGSGNYLGWCATPANASFCNDKLIGAYDFAFASVTGNANASEEASPEDNNGHGTHVAGTAAGNQVNASYEGISTVVSGVAPHANLVVYDACYTAIDSGRGLCPNDATTAAVEQAVADGVVDVINYSISGGNSPWLETQSLAFLNAVDAGIYIAASAGNDGPDAGTVAHLEPWVASTAASTHSRRYLQTAEVNVTGPTTPAALQQLKARKGSEPGFTTAFSGEVAFETTNPTACTASGGLPTSMVAKVALIQRGDCSFVEKVNNAHAKGAVGVVIYNNVAGEPTLMNTDGTVIRSVMVSKTDGEAIRDYAANNANATIQVNPLTPAVPIFDANEADVIADFSSRGPNRYDLLKPNLAAPGQDILAALENGGSSTTPEFGLKSGTSMSSPHHAGAAALMRAIKPSWKVDEIRSALMMTAKNGMDAMSDSGRVSGTSLDQGSGRIDLSKAAQSGLVMNETSLKYLNANPDNGGDPSKLNIPSMASNRCVNICSWSRTLRSSLATSETWDVSFVGQGNLTGTVTAGLSATTNFTLNPYEEITLNIEADVSSASAEEKLFGDVVLTSTSGQTLTLPVYVVAAGPRIKAAPDSLLLNQDTDATSSADFTITNEGGFTLSYDVNNTSTATITPLQQLDTTTSGFRSYIAPSTGVFLADDLDVGSTLEVTEVFAAGFVPSSSLAAESTEIRWYIYTDSSGSPSGHPAEATSTALWAHTAALNAPEVDISNDSITLNVTHANVPALTLQPGKYWLVVTPVITDTAQSWAWSFVQTQVGEPAKIFDNGRFGLPPLWFSMTDFNASWVGLGLSVSGSVNCGASWYSLSQTTGSLANAQSDTITVTTNSAGMNGGSYTAYACMQSNDQTEPTKALPIVMSVTNRPPTAASGQTIALNEGESSSTLDGGSTSLLYGANDPDDQTMVITTTPVNAPAHGSLTLSPAGTFTYEHDGSETTTDAFRYELCDTGSPKLCVEADVAITINPVNDAPSATADALVVAEGGETSVTNQGAVSLLANDTDPESEPLTLTTTPTTAPTYGTVVLNVDGTFKYTHDGSQTSSDSFVYEMCDTGSPVTCASATVSVVIANTNDAPEVQGESLVVDVSGTVTQTTDGNNSLLDNDSDPDNNSLTVQTTPAQAPQHGSVTIQADGTFSYEHDGSSAAQDSFVYVVCDNGSPQLCSQGTVNVSTNNQAPIAVDDSFNVNEDGTFEGSVASNDSDPDGHDLTYSVVTDVTDGTLVFNDDGTFTYTAAAGFQGEVTFVYKVTDGSLETQATVSLNILSDVIFSSGGFED